MTDISRNSWHFKLFCFFDNGMTRTFPFRNPAGPDNPVFDDFWKRGYTRRPNVDLCTYLRVMLITGPATLLLNVLGVAVALWLIASPALSTDGLTLWIFLYIIGVFIGGGLLVGGFLLLCFGIATGYDYTKERLAEARTELSFLSAIKEYYKAWKGKYCPMYGVKD